ncbi:hypothetical protein ACYFX5_09220 [Bremerella sp. T1]|uniref:hypothetical protein n=1 Tax=Bremerella sp. TYQ1 TaxID=3119568 RepID=UPI001CCC799F|nr:hypothetical protein [Bremerella volcania]UBM38433.1 hypothetical protein LA756_11155 [Bremerella volcania]
MAVIYKDRVMEVTTTAGTGTLTLGGALPSCRPFSVCGDGATVRYTIEQGDDYETGEGVYTLGSNSLTRATLKHSSTGSKLNLTGGPAYVFLSVTEQLVDELLAGPDFDLVEESPSTFGPKTNNATDCGSLAKQWRRGYFQHVSINGQTIAPVTNLTLLGINTRLYDLEDRPRVGYDGLRLSRTSGHQIAIQPGYAHNNDYSNWLRVESPITVDLSVAGSFVNGAARSLNTWYHFLIGHETATGDVVAGLSTTLAKPSGWDDWQMVGAMRTNGVGSGDWDLFVQDGDWFFQPLEIQQYSVTTQGTGETAVRCWCPAGSYRVKNFLRASNSTAGFYCLIRQVPAGAWWLAPHVITGRYVNVEFDMVTDSLGNFYFANTASSNFDIFSFTGRAFRYPIGNAANV